MLVELPECVADEARKVLVLYLLRMGKLRRGKADELRSQPRAMVAGVRCPRGRAPAMADCVRHGEGVVWRGELAGQQSGHCGDLSCDRLVTPVALTGACECTSGPGGGYRVAALPGKTVG